MFVSNDPRNVKHHHFTADQQGHADELKDWQVH